MSCLNELLLAVLIIAHSKLPNSRSQRVRANTLIVITHSLTPNNRLSDDHPSFLELLLISALYIVHVIHDNNYYV